MIILYHDKDKVVNSSYDGNFIDYYTGKEVTEALFLAAQAHPEQCIGWCKDYLKNKVDWDVVQTAVKHPLTMVSASAHHNLYFPDAIAYIEDSPFLKINREVVFPTWMASSDVGLVYAAVINQLRRQDFKEDSFPYVLNAIAKSCQAQGLFCYQLPRIRVEERESIDQATQRELYRFVKQHYKTQWVFFLFVSQLLFDKRCYVSALLSSLWVKKRAITFQSPHIFKTESPLQMPAAVDVIIPTMGRSQYLYDVLIDFSKQTLLPEKVIIIEQNPEPNSTTDLAYVYKEDWPFTIIHEFIHTTGACNARNIALGLTTAEWVFFADDDIRFQKDLFEKALIALRNSQGSCVAMSCLQKNEKKTFNNRMQWSSFPSGASMVKGTLSRKLSFNTSYEHGYGEDADYGMQLRNAGADVLYHPDLELVHLKAPVGGFRQKIVQAWEAEGDLPKPSPTIMLFRLKHNTLHQLRGYKLQLYIRQWGKTPLLKKFGFIKSFKKRWNASVKWAKILEDR